MFNQMKKRYQNFDSCKFDLEIALYYFCLKFKFFSETEKYEFVFVLHCDNGTTGSTHV